LVHNGHPSGDAKQAAGYINMDYGGNLGVKGGLLAARLKKPPIKGVTH